MDALRGGAASSPEMLQEKLPHVGSQLRLSQEGLADAKAALEDDGEDAVALRAMALHAALIGAPEKGMQPLEQASKLAPGDPWLAWTRAALLLAAPPSPGGQHGARAARAAARHA